jgi:hypothetical protein
MPWYKKDALVEKDALIEKSMPWSFNVLSFDISCLGKKS